MKQYAVYKGDVIRAVGTAKECAKELNVKQKYIYWLTSPTAKKILAKRKSPENCTVCIRLEDDEQ
ncbi:hypothetical protein [Sediminibacillus albus]|uniref:Uncharacterized protein n=1 Tax=Sediminibacillus albus TaxID=407036 RepID=A0A1G9C8J3_9BACI|nr:hypothetical protein [Sediminibacillus albus]SDK47715.1 hypothetical protein SAMN05216243_3298 [Sediminibacillus albus]